jgi:hypothetical protein
MFEKIGVNESKILRYLEDYLPTRVLTIFELNLQCMSSMQATMYACTDLAFVTLRASETST